MQKLFTFDPVIYPRLLWISVGKERFNDRFEGLSEFPENANAQYEHAFDNIDGKGGVFIRFASFDDIVFQSVAHESLHAALKIFEYIEAEVETSNQEPICYLTGWIAKCLQEVKDELQK